MLQRLRDESGGVLVLTALMMVVMLGFAALATDAGILYVHRLSLVNSTEAAALAGVQELPLSTWAAERRAIAYAEMNGLSESVLSVSVSQNRREITVEAFRDVDLFFAPVLGIHSSRVSARARARVGTVAAFGRGAVPLGIQQQPFVFGEQYMLKEGSQPGDGVYRGNFGALALGGNGASTFEQNLSFGFEGELRVGDQVWTEPGNMAGPTARAVQYRMNQDANRPGCEWGTQHVGCSRVLIVPIIDGYSGGGRNQVTIVGFAAFWLEGTGRRGTDSYVIGRFIEMAVDGEDGPSGEFGLRSYRLID